jgi:hypothetical protein
MIKKVKLLKDYKSRAGHEFKKGDIVDVLESFEDGNVRVQIPGFFLWGVLFGASEVEVVEQS